MLKVLVLLFCQTPVFQRFEPIKCAVVLILTLYQPLFHDFLTSGCRALLSMSSEKQCLCLGIYLGPMCFAAAVQVQECLWLPCIGPSK